MTTQSQNARAAQMAQGATQYQLAQQVVQLEDQLRREHGEVARDVLQGVREQLAKSCKGKVKCADVLDAIDQVRNVL